MNQPRPEPMSREELDAPYCSICGKIATQRDIDGDWWPPCEHAKTHRIAILAERSEEAP